MIDSNSNIFWQLKRKQEQENLLTRGLNPGISADTTVFSNFQSAVPNTSVKKNYNWSRRYFYYKQDSLIPLNPDILNYSTDRILFEEFPSENGNLTVSNVSKNIINVFNANIFKNSSSSSDIYLNWSGGIAIYLNSGVVTKNDYTPFISQVIPLNFNSGWNELQVFLYSIDDSQSFSLNSEIGLSADNWSTPSLSEPDTPSNFSATVDLNASSYKDGNSIISRWDSTDPNKTFGYNIYRVGPYNSGLNTPILTSNTSGYFVSGLGLKLGGQVREAYYTVSSFNANGESLPATTRKVSLKPEFSGVYLSSGISSNVSGGALSTGFYSYIIAATNPIGSKFSSDGNILTLVLNSGNSSTLFWSGVSDINSYSIYRFSGIVSTSTENIPSITGQLIATIPNSSISFVDSGYITPYMTGISELISDNIDLNFFGPSPSNYKNNSAYLGWSGVANASGYYIYRTFYSGNYDKNSLIGTTTGLFFIDSGINSQQGKPTLAENIISLNYGTKKFKDQGVIGNQTYKYSISSFNYSLNESLQSSGIQVTVGDPFAPATPSGITITSFNGFTTIGWLNGTENDLAGTNIYSSNDNITYGVLGTTVGTAFSTFIGYSGSPYFKLSNFDTSDNESPLSSAYQGSGTLIADSVVLKTFRLLSTVEIGVDYYIYSGYSGATSSPFRTCLSSSISAQGGNNNDYIYAFTQDSSKSNTTLIHRVLENGQLEHILLSGNAPSGISGIAGTIVSTTSVNSTSNAYLAYYSGALSNGDWKLHYRTYGLPDIAGYTPLSSSTTGINVGNSFNSYVGQGGGIANYQYRPTPILLTRSGDASRTIIVYLSGNQNDQKSVGFGCINYNDGLVTGIWKYMPINFNNTISANGAMSACMDSSGYIHLVWSAQNDLGYTPNIYYKVLYNPTNNNPITIMTSGQYTHGINGAYLYQQNSIGAKYKQDIPQMVYDNNNEINIFYKPLSTNPGSRFTIYSKIDTNGNVILDPNLLYQLQFDFDENFTATYNSIDDTIYTSYNMLNLPQNQRNRVYGYLQGTYRRRHDFQNFTNANLYQIMQSISK